MRQKIELGAAPCRKRQAERDIATIAVAPGLVPNDYTESILLEFNAETSFREPRFNAHRVTWDSAGDSYIEVAVLAGGRYIMPWTFSSPGAIGTESGFLVLPERIARGEHIEVRVRNYDTANTHVVAAEVEILYFDTPPEAA